jgi:flagellar secretion chaperone FliS
MTSPTPAMRARYLADTIHTASPGKLLMMLFDRLVLDLVRGEQALLADNRPEANAQLTHAQDIISELHMSLVMDAWAGAPALAQLYSFAVTELVNANVRGDAAQVASTRGLIEPLRDTWREAASAAAVGG